MTINDENYILFNYYAPTKDKPQEQIKEFDILSTMLTKYENKNIILAGDFNVCMNPEIDKVGGKKEKQSDYARKLIDLAEEMDLTDIWRKRNPDIKQFTRRQNTRGGMVHSRIDLFLVPLHLEYRISYTEIKPSIHSDHSMIEMCLEGDKNAKHGKGFWKFNSELLTDQAYVVKVKKCIKETIETNGNIEDKGLLRDVIKYNIKGMSISHSSFKAK